MILKLKISRLNGANSIQAYTTKYFLEDIYTVCYVLAGTKCHHHYIIGNELQLS